MPDAAGPPSLPPGGAPEPDGSVSFHTALGYGDERAGLFSPTGIAAGFSLLVRWGRAGAGLFAEGAAGGARDSSWLGLTGGLLLDPVRWARLELLGEAGFHHLGVESDYASQPTAYARLPFLGLRAGATAYLDVLPDPRLLWARRAGIGVRLGLRSDLGRAWLRPGVPPELPPAARIRVGGHATSLVVVLPLEW